jgi:hypothetical protein
LIGTEQKGPCAGEEQMRRRITRQTQSQETATFQALTDYKEATLKVLLAKIPEKMTFAQLGELLGRSHEWVRVRLVKKPEELFRIGNRYLVPKGVAEAFVRSVLV